MTSSRPDGRAFAELLDVLRAAEQTFLEGRNQTADEELADNYRHLLDLVSLGYDMYMANDWERPRFARIVSPWRKMGGDNAHALYDFAPLCGDRSYRVRGRINRVAYMGFTTYGGESEERVHITSNHNSSDLRPDRDGRFAIVLSPHETDDRAPLHVRLLPESHSLIVRQYFLDRDRSGEAELAIEPLDEMAPPAIPSGESVAQRLRSIAAFIRGWTTLSPLPWPADPDAYNRITPPMRASASTGHWSTPDNIHAFGFFQLEDDEALLIRGRSPECLYWSCHLWNSCMQTFNYVDYRTSLCKKEAVLDDDGRFTIVVARRDPGRPNWLDTTGYRRGFVYFRWLLAASLPEPLECEVVRGAR